MIKNERLRLNYIITYVAVEIDNKWMRMRFDHRLKD